MVFSSQTFLFFFLPLAGLCVLIRSKPVQNAMLLIRVADLLRLGEPKMVVLMVLVTLVAYGSGFAIVHFEARPRAKKAALIAAIVVILGNLVVFKYLNFLCRTFSFLGLTDPAIALPIGISFYTFQILSYVIDLYRGQDGRCSGTSSTLTLYVELLPAAHRRPHRALSDRRAGNPGAPE